MLKLFDCLMRLIKPVYSRVINPMAKIDVLEQPIGGHFSLKPYLGFTMQQQRLRLPDNVEILQHWQNLQAFQEPLLTKLFISEHPVTFRNVRKQQTPWYSRLRNVAMQHEPV